MTQHADTPGFSPIAQYMTNPYHRRFWADCAPIIAASTYRISTRLPRGTGRLSASHSSRRSRSARLPRKSPSSGASLSELRFSKCQAAPLPEERRVPNLDLRTHVNKYMCFEVPDVPRAVTALRPKGADVAFERAVEGNPTAFIRDIAGNLIELLEPFAIDRVTA